MTPNEEYVYRLIKKDKAHSIRAIMHLENRTNASNYDSIILKLVRDGKIIKKDCPTCDKSGYFEVC